MRLIEREHYLSKLKDVIGTPDIKVITGVRRSGKSKLLESFIKYVAENIPDANVIHVNFNLHEYEEFMEYHALYDHITSHYAADKRNFVMIDEIQMCEGFEKAINWLHASEKYDIYITGSNAFLLSSDLATLFTGRTFPIEVYPFSFKEFMRYYALTDQYAAFRRYMNEGGMSGSYVYKDLDKKYRYIAEIFDTLILRDIRKKNNIKLPALLDRVTDFLMDNVSNLTNARNIADTLRSNREKTDHKTVARYLDYLCRAFAFYKVRRYDIRGKRYLSISNKYYLSDHAFRYAKLGTKNPDNGRILENIVAIELLRRGYEVYVGVLYQKEIDFVAMRRDEQIYIQVANSIESPETFRREVDPLLKIRDAYPKMIITRTGLEPYQYEGIRIIDIADWLLI